MSLISPVGFELQVRYWLSSRFTVGAGGDWATFVQNRDRNTQDINSTTTITATAYNYMQTSNLRAQAQVYLLDQGPVMPYIGANFGVGWTTFYSEVADLVFSDTQASVLFGGDIGAAIPLSERGTPLAMVNLRWSMAPAAEFLNGVENVQTLGLSLGVGL